MSRSVAIVGSGPGGFYCAEALNRRAPELAIDIIDRLPTPFGLVRAGVAPDHQSTKVITRVFDRVAQKPNLRLLGHLCLGRDVSLAELRERYDAVVLAFGAPRDRALGIPGERTPGVLGSGAFVGWYNGHPDWRALPVELSAVRRVAVIGNGNVAVDVARVLAKTPAEMARSDLPAHAAAELQAAPLREIHMIGRRGPIEANFTNVELAELGRLERCVPLVLPGDLPEAVGPLADEKQRKVKEANLATLRSFAANRPEDKPVALRFHFWTAPVAILGDGRVTGLRLVSTRGGTAELELAADLVITCIGYSCEVPEGVPLDPEKGIVPNRDGRVEPGLYVAGWAKRGPTGTIATNRPDSMTVAETILQDLGSLPAKPGPAALDALLAARGIRPVSYSDWQRIDAAECRAGGGVAPRRKLVSLDELLQVARAR